MALAKTLKYRADIDGLRAIAVLVVILYHFGFEVFSGGYVGVDIFFVVSGYLITSIIIRDIERGQFTISRFYERRFRRILPALAVVIAATIIAGAMLLDSNRFADLGQSAVATSIFSSNILFYLESGYFDAPAELKPLLHTWSLAVEEQFYIFFPLLLMVIGKSNRKNYFKYVSILAGLSFIACVLLTNVDRSASFYLIPSRAWELLIGSILALNILPQQGNRLTRESLSILGILMIAFAVLRFSDKTAFPGIAASIPTIGTALILYSGATGESYLSRMLSLRPAVFVGLISYSLYLWHWPILVFAKHYFILELAPNQIVLILLLLFSLSYLTWRLVETPFRTKLVLKEQRALLGTSAAVSFAILCCGLLIDDNRGFTQRYSEIVETIDFETDAEWMQWKSCEDVYKRIKNSLGLCDIGSSQGEEKFILWGDSHAKASASGVHYSAANLSIKGKIATESGCPPLIGIVRPDRSSCTKFNQAVLSYISSNSNIKTVILAARWALSTTGERYKRESGTPVRLLDRENPIKEMLSNPQIFNIGITRTIEEIQRLGKAVVIVGPIPEVGYDVPSAYFISEITGRDVNSIVAPTVEEFQERTKDVTTVFETLSKEKRVQVVSPRKFLCDSLVCKVSVLDELLYRDDDHLSTFGSKYISKLFDPVFNQMNVML